MTIQPWKYIGNHINPEKEEALKWAKIEIESQVKRVIKLTKSMSHGNKEKNTRSKSEAINIVEDFQKQYESLYSMYEDLREQVKRNVKASELGDADENISSPGSISEYESFYSPGGSNTGQDPIMSNAKKGLESSSDSNEPDQTSDLDDTILKDKLTSSSQVKEITESVETLKDLRVPEEELQNITSSQVEGFKRHIESLELEISKLHMEKEELKEQVEGKSNEAMELKDKTEALSEEVKLLTSELENEKNRFEKAVETEKNRMQSDLDKEKEEYFSPCKFLVEKFSKSNFQVVERKVDEMLDEYRKQLDDKYRMLSRRIRVAEQLQAENKEWYRKMKEAFEQQNQDLMNRAERKDIDLQHVKDMTLSANHTLKSMGSVALHFEECSANFLNKISKASCELKFVKHCAMRKNKSVSHERDDLDCLPAQLDDKEREIQRFREKVRELEKTVKEKEDGMLGLMEEKREAIRQLCVWIDYHRERSDYYMKKMLSEMNLVRFKRGHLH